MERIRVKKEIIKGGEVIREEIIECKIWKGIRAYATEHSRKDFYVDLKKQAVWENRYRGGYELGKVYGFDPKFRYTLVKEDE